MTLPANPLNESGAMPPETLFSLHQASSHHVTALVGVAAATVLSPRTNAPRLGKAKTIAVLPLSAEGR